MVWGLLESSNSNLLALYLAIIVILVPKEEINREVNITSELDLQLLREFWKSEQLSV